MFLRNKDAMIATVSAVFALIFLLFFYGILAVHLITDLDIGENSVGNNNFILNYIGYFFGLVSATYALSSPFVAFFASIMPCRWLTFISFYIATAALLLLGPSQLL